MALDRVSAETTRGRPGVPNAHEFVVRLTDDDGNPVARKSVTFTASPPGSVLFGGNQYAAVETDAHGIASTRGTINDVGRFAVTAKAPPGDREHTVAFIAEGTTETEVHQVGDDILVIDGGGGQGTRVPMWPIAAMVIAGLVIGGVLLMAAMFRSGRGGGTPIVHLPPPSPGPTAVVDADARRAAEDAARQAAILAERTDRLAAEKADLPYVNGRDDEQTRQLAVGRRSLLAHLRKDGDDDAVDVLCRGAPWSPACTGRGR